MSPDGTKSFECRILGLGPLETELPTGWNDCTSRTTYSALDPGRYRFSVRAVDGDAQGEPTSWTWEVVGPQAPERASDSKDDSAAKVVGRR